MVIRVSEIMFHEYLAFVSRSNLVLINITFNIL